MKKLLYVILMSTLIVACAQKEDLGSSKESNAGINLEEHQETAPVNAVLAPDFSVFEYINTFTEPFEKPDNEVAILRVDIKYPFIKNASDHVGLEKIHFFYKDAYDTMRDYISEEALVYAREDMKAAEAIEGHFIGHSLTVDFDIVYQDLEKISILVQGSDFTGGAHGNHWLEASTFDLMTGEVLELHEVLGLDEDDCKAYVFKAMEVELKQAENETIYYEDALETYEDAYNFKDFYLKDDHIVIFFQSYAIAPYAAGIPSFKLNYPEK